MEGRDIPAFFILYIFISHNFIFVRFFLESDFAAVQSEKLDWNEWFYARHAKT
jgi:hypothetical protein